MFVVDIVDSRHGRLLVSVRFPDVAQRVRGVLGSNLVEVDQRLHAVSGLGHAGDEVRIERAIADIRAKHKAA